MLEDKIVSVLGCMLSLLNKGREDVLSGRVSIMSTFRVEDVSTMEDKLPPLAVFRGEMKRCCESLHIALENYLTPDDTRSLDVWRKLQRLKNVCYDSGFPRQDDYPCPTLVANWSPVYLSSSKEETELKDSEFAFWRGGQVTDEGLKWLMEKGVKTIVDMRAEMVKDTFYESAVEEAVLSGKVELVKIPVEAQTAPSMAQVEKFASLVSDGSKRPLFLHSKEGVWRTFAMVSRWRQYMSRNASQSISSQPVSSNGMSSPSKSGLGESETCSNIQGQGFLLAGEYNSVEENLDKSHTLNGTPYNDDSTYKDNEHKSDKVLPSSKGEYGEVESLGRFNTEIDPLKAQVPPCNFFSKREMSGFLKSKKVTPLQFFNNQSKRSEMSAGENRLSGSVSGHSEAKNTNGAFSSLTVSPVPKSSRSGSENSDDLDYSSVKSSVNGFGKRDMNSMTTAVVSNAVSSKLNEDAMSQTEEVKSSSGQISIPRDDDLDQIDGNMCASATGVVRVQSRRKAEMFLVRTDGFSCTREKVTESSLAFTHPSTQQQMLMWKSTPKTVLLLKKPGQALMEEAKEVHHALSNSKCFFDHCLKQ